MKGKPIIKTGEPADYVYFIIEGEVTVKDEYGTYNLASLGPGSFFGDYHIVLGVKSTLNFVADIN